MVEIILRHNRFCAKGAWGTPPKAPFPDELPIAIGKGGEEGQSTTGVL